MKILNAFLILSTLLLAITSIIFFAWNDVADAIYCLVWAVLIKPKGEGYSVDNNRYVKIPKKLRSAIETARVMADRDLVKLLREAREDIKAGRTVPLSSLRK